MIAVFKATIVDLLKNIENKKILTDHISVYICIFDITDIKYIIVYVFLNLNI